jgi:hypothetical protein
MKTICVRSVSNKDYYCDYSKALVELLDMEINGMLGYIAEIKTNKGIILSTDVLGYDVEED